MRLSRRDFMLSATGSALAAGAGGCALAKQRGATNAGWVAKLVGVGGALKIEINGQVFDPPAYRSCRLFGIHMQGDTVCEDSLPGCTSGRLTELFDGGETECANGRFMFARRPGYMKLFVFEKGEFSPVTKG